MADEQKSSSKSQLGIVRFLRGVLRFVRNYLIFVGALVTLLPVLMVFALSHGAKGKHKIALGGDQGGPALSSKNPVTLHLTYEGKIAEHEPSSMTALLNRFFHADNDIYLPEIRSTLRRAAKDKRVSGIVVTFGSVQASPADYAEMRRQLEDFRKNSQKPVTVALAEAEDWNYYVASAASRIIINPASPVSIPGPAFHLVYFGEALRKIGVDIDVVRAGKYKSAFEPFVLNAPTEPTLEEYSTMQKSLLDHIVTLVAAGRGKSEAVVREWYKHSLYTADEALKAGMIDEIGYPPPLGSAGSEGDNERASDEPASPKPQTGKSTKEAAHKVAPSLALQTYAERLKLDETDDDAVSGKGGIGLIEAFGEIKDSASSNPNADNINPGDMARQIRWALENKEVKAVVLRLSSPGGSAIASDQIWEGLNRLAKAKPLVVSMGAYGASGGYYISVPAKKIFAEATTLTGSIGVIGMLPSVHAFEEKYGVSMHIVSSSDRRSMLNMGTKASAEDKAMVERTIDQVYRVFLQKVADGRHLKPAQVEAMAQGRVYTGVQAKDLGLIDEIGGLQNAITAAKQMAGFDVNKLYPLLHFEDDDFNLAGCLDGPTKLMRCLGRGDSELRLGLAAAAPSLANPDVASAALELRTWLSATRSGQALVLWPGYWGVQLR